MSAQHAGDFSPILFTGPVISIHIVGIRNNEDTALAIPKRELARLGLRHQDITGTQMSLYKAFDKTGNPLTWDAIEHIETEALVANKMDPVSARNTVRAALQPLKDAGNQPTRIPWGRKVRWLLTE